MITEIFDWLTAMFKAVVAVFVMIAVMNLVSIAMYFTGFDYDTYQGLFNFAYGVIAIAAMVLLLLPNGAYAKKQPLRTGKLIGFEPFWLFVIAFALMGATTIYLIGINLASETNEAVNEAANEYSEAMDRFSNVEENLVPNWDHWLYFISTFLLIPMVEELVFRGAVLGSFRKVSNPVVAIILSSAVFGLLHGLTIHIVYALACGLMLGYVYVKCDSIWASYIVHAVFNLCGSSLLTFLESGVINISENSINRIYGGLALSEMAAIVPGIIAILFINQGRKQLAKTEASVSVEAEVEA